MKALISGNEAIARGVWEANGAVAVAYPGTPSTEILETIGKIYPEITSTWTTNEKTALETAYGAAMAGGRAIACMKHVGLNVAADPLFTASYSGVHKGLIIITADDPSMHSSQNEQDNRLYGRFAKVPVLEPADSQEAKDFVKLGFQLSEDFDTPVILRLTTLVSHTKTIVELEETVRQPTEYSFNFQDGKFVNLPSSARKHHLQVEERLKKLSAYNSNSPFNRWEKGPSKIGIITCGMAYQYAREAFPDAHFLKLGMVFPLPWELIHNFSRSVETLYIIEELEPFLEEPIRAAGIPIAVGKGTIPICYELSTDIIRQTILGEKTECREVPALPHRPPVLCPGCPHRGIYYSLNKLKATVNGDIGCYTLGYMPPLNALHTCICMGASITNANGFEMIKQRSGSKQRVVATIGDSTFIHSGITGLIDAIYNQLNTTIMILDNDITAMTGHQPNPVTGIRINGTPSSKLDLKLLCQAIGIEKVDVVDPYDLAQIQHILLEHFELESPSVIISKRPCALLPHLKKERIFFSDPNRCKKCKMCLKLGCPAINWDGERITIDPNSCFGCSLCAQVCRFSAIEEVQHA